ncbi:MAG: hypothetical protein HW402_1540 [Dehalococcoidales bacterium]|nr:hypothetical protein [Dehalococcoidales bacterium]
MPRNSSGAGSHEEIARIWAAIKTLGESLDAIKQEMTSLKDAFSDLSRTLSGDQNAGPSRMPDPDECYHFYAREVSTISIVRKVMLTGSAESPTVWTIIDNPPRQDSPLKTSYDDERNTLEILKFNMPLNLDIVNASQAQRRKQLREPGAKIIWQRS